MLRVDRFVSIALRLLLRAASYEKEFASGFGFRATERDTHRLEKRTLGTPEFGPFSTPRWVRPKSDGFGEVLG